MISLEGILSVMGIVAFITIVSFLIKMAMEIFNKEKKDYER